MPEPLDAEQILRVLAAHDVDYVVIGGIAVQTHGHMRTTFDLDLLPAPSPENLGRLAAALKALGARVLNAGAIVTELDVRDIPRAAIWQLATNHGPIDVLNEAPGAASYDDLRVRALVVRLGDIEIAVAGRDDLIAMKRAAGRPQDLDDVAALTEQEHREG